MLRSSFAMGICRGGNRTRLRSVKSRTEARDTGPIWDPWGSCRYTVGDETVWVFCGMLWNCTLCHGDLLS